MTLEPNNQMTHVFDAALAALVEAIPGFTATGETKTVSDFTTNCAEILQKVNGGEAQLLGAGEQRYLLLSEAHVISLAGCLLRTTTLGDIVRSVTPPTTLIETSSVYLPGAKSQPFTLPKGFVK